MKRYIFILFALTMNCFVAQTVSYNKINKKAYETIFNNIKPYSTNTQLSIAILKNDSINFIGIQKVKDSILFVENYKKCFEIGSITKVFTSTLLAHFIENGKINLDDNIQDYLSFTVNTEHEITFKQLSNHTSGLPRLPSNLNLVSVDKDNPYKNYGEKELISYLSKKIKSNIKPKVNYAYSNLGAGILGFVLFTYNKSSYENLLQRIIFQKYKMINSTSKKDKLKSELIIGQKQNGKPTPNWDLNILAGAGGIFSTAEDLSNFALAQFDTSNKELSLTQKPTFTVNANLSIGLGWHIIKQKNGNKFLWHNGGTGGYKSSMVLDVKNKSGVIVLSNVSGFHIDKKNIDKLSFNLMKITNTNH